MNNLKVEKVEKLDQSDLPKMMKNSSADTLGKLRGDWSGYYEQINTDDCFKLNF